MSKYESYYKTVGEVGAIHIKNNKAYHGFGRDVTMRIFYKYKGTILTEVFSRDKFTYNMSAKKWMDSLIKLIESYSEEELIEKYFKGKGDLK